MKLLTLLAGLLAAFSALPTQAQGVGIGTAGAPAPSATLEIKSTTGGLLLPRMTATQRAAIPSPTDGLLVFQTDGTPGLYYYVGGAWVNLTTGLIPDAAGNAGASATTRVSTLAGNGTAGLVDATGTAALFNGPSGVALDGNGNAYVADQQNNDIRKIVVSTGVVTVLDGQGPMSIGPGSITYRNGYPQGNTSGSVMSALFYNPTGVACDGNGNVYVADQQNNCIRKIVVSTGYVTTLAGSYSSTGPGGIAPPAGYVDGTGDAARFNNPTGVAYDGNGNLYVADQGNHVIRKIVVSTGVVTTLAGTGTPGFVNSTSTGPAARFNNPTGVACDGNGNVYVADQGNHSIRKIAPYGTTSTRTSTLAGTSAAGFAEGMGAAAQFNNPTGVTCDATGNVYVADRDNHRIRKIVASTGEVSTLAGSGSPGFVNGSGAAAQFNGPTGVAVDASNTVYVADYGNNRIRLIK